MTTPEAPQAMLTGRKLRKALPDVCRAIVNGIYELTSAKRSVQLTVDLGYLHELVGTFQRVGLLVTVGLPDEIGKFLVGDYPSGIIEVNMDNHIKFGVVCSEVMNEDEALVRGLATGPEMTSRVRTIQDIVRDHESVPIFINTKQTAGVLGLWFKSLGDSVEIHHGPLSKNVHIDVEDRFKAGELGTLIHTSSMELDIDMGRIDHIVQYNGPREVS